MKKLFTVLFALLGSFALSKAQVKVDVGVFNELDVTDKLNVILIPSEEQYVSIEGDLSDKVEVIQIDDKLRIKMAKGNPLKGANTFIKVYNPHIYRFTVQKGAVVQNDNNKLESDSIIIWANEGGKTDLLVNTGIVKVNSTTGATVGLRGEAKSQEVYLTFGGNYDGEKLQSDKVLARTSGGGVCNIRAAVSADVQTRAGGYINVYGNPSERKQKRFAGGKISFME